ncbi:hypothetical protein [Deinococcus yavapaiensis]|uniref:Uncharacterized protein n=1 Tax=Deinococcus yavapaiensis KR-236 TaxID=694435 RepID=A0A318SAA0_9DEIO|nr:hypothetical protein [Deinococcus yavapaiensis]PYE53410.1 hypothetical protein DES52_109187 [Deinococcus yavapaiensis KR-236]
MLRRFVLVAASLGTLAFGGVSLAQTSPRAPGILSYPLLTPEPQASESFPLLFSDSPETPRSPGVLYRDVVTGKARVVAYHANGLREDARVLILARPSGAQDVTFTTLRRGSAITRGADPVIGQQTLLRFFASGPLPSRVVPPSATAVLFDSGIVAPSGVASVMLDVETQAPLELSVVLLSARDARNAAALLPTLPVLPRDANHQRGTFPNAVRTLRVNVSSVPSRLVIGGGPDPVLVGVDALTGEVQRLAGNYGLSYEFEFAGASDLVLAASARGGAYRGSVFVVDGERRSQLLVGDGQALKDSAVPEVLWNVRSDVFRLSFVPSNASSLPLALIFYKRR